ncbi:MAG: CAP domain-containing protein [Blastocatellia bacterium]|nr:CAP domain-containing protein [Blastocatellia bacterium]
MRRGFSLSVLIAASILMPVLVCASQAGSQRSGGTNVGSGREGRGPELRDAAPDESRPLAGGHTLRDIERLETECLEEINRQRRAHRVKPLEFSQALLPIARAYSQRMAEGRFFSHTDPEGRTIRQRVDEAGIRWTTLGENLASSNGYINPVAVSMRGWMNSPTHRQNILDTKYTVTAVGVWVSQDGTIYFTEIFMRE